MKLFPSFCSLFYNVLNLPFNETLSKDTLTFKLIALILPFIFMRCSARFKCKREGILLMCGLTKIVHFRFGSSYIRVYFVPTETVEMLHSTNSTVYVS